MHCLARDSSSRTVGHAGQSGAVGRWCTVHRGFDSRFCTCARDESYLRVSMIVLDTRTTRSAYLHRGSHGITLKDYTVLNTASNGWYLVDSTNGRQVSWSLKRDWLPCLSCACRGIKGHLEKGMGIHGRADPSQACRPAKRRPLQHLGLHTKIWLMPPAALTRNYHLLPSAHKYCLNLSDIFVAPLRSTRLCMVPYNRRSDM